MKSTGTQYSNGLQWFDLKIGYWDSSPKNGYQGDMSHSSNRNKGLNWCKFCIFMQSLFASGKPSEEISYVFPYIAVYSLVMYKTFNLYESFVAVC